LHRPYRQPIQDESRDVTRGENKVTEQSYSGPVAFNDKVSMPRARMLQDIKHTTVSGREAAAQICSQSYQIYSDASPA